jgi:hypothetical protein
VPTSTSVSVTIFGDASLFGNPHNSRPPAIRHPDELVFDQRLRHFERFGHHRGQRLRIGAIGDDEEFPVEKSIRPRGNDGLVIGME